MKLFELATALIVGIGVYWVVISWFDEPQCYVQTNENPYVAKWMSCEDVPAEWSVLEVK